MWGLEGALPLTKRGGEEGREGRRKGREGELEVGKGEGAERELSQKLEC